MSENLKRSSALRFDVTWVLFEHHAYCGIYFHKCCTYIYCTSVKCNESVPDFHRYFRLYIGLYYYDYCYFFSACWRRIWYGTEFCNSGCSEYQAHARAIGSLPSEFTGNILLYLSGLPWQPLISIFIKYISYDSQKLRHEMPLTKTLLSLVKNISEYMLNFFIENRIYRYQKSL